MTRQGISRVFGAATGGAANAGWFGDGRDGDLTVAAGQTLALEVAADEGQIIKQYNSLTLEAGSVLTASNRCNGMILLVKGDLNLEGHIHMDGKCPLVNPLEDTCLREKHIVLCGNLTGGKGGNGGKAGGTGINADGGTGGEGHALGGGWPGGGGARHSWINGGANYYAAYNGGDGIRPPIGTTLPYPAGTTSSTYGAGGSAKTGGTIKGGAGPGGSGAYGSDGSNGTAGRNGSAYPGGALYVFVGGNVTISSTGVLSANGGDGASGERIVWNDHAGGGGAAGGGIVALVYAGAYNNAGSICANGGVGGPSGNTMSPIAGGDGAMGSLLITTLDELLKAS